MKKLFKNLMKTLTVAAMLFAGASFTYAAGEFIHYDPMGGSHGITSVSKTGFTARSNEINVSIPNPGDSQTFKVYVAYQNVLDNNILYDAKGTLIFDATGTSHSTTIKGVLTGSHAEYEADSAYLNNLPSSWSLHLDSARKVNTHYENRYPQCTGSGAPYDYNYPMDLSQITTSGAFIDHLDYVGEWHGVTGSCDQGYIVATFTVKNTTTPALTLNVDTNTPTGVTTHSATLNGEVVSGSDVDTWFALSTSSNPSCSISSQRINVSGLYNSGQSFDKTVTGLNPSTHYYYRACGDQNGTIDAGGVEDFTTAGSVVPNLNVVTDTPIHTHSTDTTAKLRGKLTSGDNAKVWFAFSTNSNPDCSNLSQRKIVSNGYTYDAPRDFDYVVTGLNPDTYYYRACAEYQNGTSDEGLTESFTVTQNQVSPAVDVRTGGVTHLSTHSATLNGGLTNGNNVDVWFAFDKDSVVLNCINSPQVGYQSNISAPHEFSFDASNLEANTDYHYMACARPAFSSIRTNPVHGDVVSFRTGQNIVIYSWHHNEWSDCIDNLRYRDVWCEDNLGNTVNDVNCSALTRPASQEACDNRQPEATTKIVYHVTKDSADLRGEVDMKDYNNGFVFFVYGQRESSVRDVVDEHRYSSIHNDGQYLRKVLVDSDLDGHDSYTKNVDGLESSERYYYRICVEYTKTNGDSDLECGSVKYFNTDSGAHHSVDIRTEGYKNVTSSSATICGDLVDKGDASDVLRWMEYRRSSTSWTLTGSKHSSEGYFCTNMTNLRSNTRYYYRACTQYGCGDEKYFTTVGGVIIPDKPLVTTDTVTVAYPHSAILPGFYVSHAPKAKVWFNYGRSRSLGNATPRQTVYGAYGEFVHNFTGLKSNQLYCYQAVIETVNGVDYGAVKCFRTPRASVVKPVVPVVNVVKEDTTEIDLSKLGLGLSLIRLDIDDDVQTVTRGQNVTYTITWENISKLDLRDLELNVEIPREVRITASSRGKLDQDRNSIFYTIDRLDAGEKNSMTINGVVENGNLGDALTATATIAFDNPVNQAQENAQDYDVDDYVLQTALGTASVFGLGNITLLGWLTILLGLFIVFLIARWLYLEREELRAQAYVNGYGRNHYMMPPTPVHNGYIAQGPAAQPVRYHVDPVVHTPQQQEVVHHVVHDTPQQATYQPEAKQAATSTQTPAPAPTERADYRPYRPNRG